ncbi:hypothetical protein D918_03833 [Trichuris suis]|nr:hypothetical protein D918_03833 [Trichuris suis]
MDSNEEPPEAILFNDIIKVGVMRKGKRGRKRFFVLHQDSYNGSARIDCYESEKRFRYGATPKLSVPLKQCFNINKKVGPVGLILHSSF